MIVAVDIGKGFHVGYFRAPNGEEGKPFLFANSAKSFNEFWHSAQEFSRKHDLEEIVVGFESSGPYAEPLFHYLRKKPVTLVQVNPFHTKRVKELTGNSPNKTDRKDPRVIADVISLGHALTLVVPKGPAAHLRRLTQARERAIKRRTAALNQIQDLIKKHPTAESVVALGLESLATIIKTTSRGKLGLQRAQELFHAAQSCVGVQEGKRSILLEIEYLVSQIGADNRFVGSLEKQMEEHLEEIAYSESILSIKGIGKVTTAGLIGEVGDFRQFGTISEITKLAGLDLFEISSGQHRGRRRISKRGRPLLRKLLYFAAINVVKTNGILHEPYQWMHRRGMPKVKALVAIARKLLRIVFALARDNTVYKEDHCHGHHLKLAA